MIKLRGFTPLDRVLVASPHPDDESIATGGLLQVARAAGAACAVVLVTDGDNNPWPQRWVEKRWRIGSAERARWGARRRTEALVALGALGVDQADVHCLGLPDLGVTTALMGGLPDVVGLLETLIEKFRPTLLVLPALEDRHPDHSAVHVLLRLALLRCTGQQPDLIAFGVHGEVHGEAGFVLELSDAQREAKRKAIEVHTTQMRLSQKRFVAFARAEEPFLAVLPPGQPSRLHPLRAGTDAAGNLQVRIGPLRRFADAGTQALFVAAQRRDGTPLRWRVRLTGTARGRIDDTLSGRPSGTAAIRREGPATTVTMASVGDLAAGWVKVGRPAPGLFVYDRIGWQSISPGQAE